MEKKKVLVTGASGLIGGIVIRTLGHKYALTGLSRRPAPDVPHLQASITDAAAIRPAFRDQHTVVHLAGYTGTPDDPGAEDWEQNLALNILGCRNVFEAAREAGVKRVVFASSGSAVRAMEHEFPYSALVNGEYNRVTEPWPLVDQTWPARPEGNYGVCKVFGEVLGRHYADRHGISVLCIRIGAVLDTDRPKMVRHFPGYLSHRDIAQMIERCIDAPESLRYDIFDAVSRNRWQWRSTEHAREVLGYTPRDTADGFTLEA